MDHSIGCHISGTAFMFILYNKSGRPIIFYGVDRKLRLCESNWVSILVIASEFLSVLCPLLKFFMLYFICHWVSQGDLTLSQYYINITYIWKVI